MTFFLNKKIFVNKHLFCVLASSFFLIFPALDPLSANDSYFKTKGEFASLNRPLIILKTMDQNNLPTRFHTLVQYPASGHPVLKNLYLVGSAQFSATQLKNALDQIRKTFAVPSNSSIYVVDLRQEYHGFINNNSVDLFGPRNWLNIYKSPQEIVMGENEWLRKLSVQERITLFNVVLKTNFGENILAEPVVAPVNKTLNEHSLVESLGAHYFRLPITDHWAPTPESIDAFMEFTNKLPEKSILYFHCRGGKGRTTTFALLRIIELYGTKHSLEVLIKAAEDLNDYNYSDLEKFNFKESHQNNTAVSFKPNTMHWRMIGATYRLKIVKAFYDYRNDPRGYKVKSFSHWLKLKGHLPWMAPQTTLKQ